MFLVWTLDKIFVPEHTVKVFSGFYGVDISTNASIFIGSVQLIFVSMLMLGLKKNVIYALALILHGLSTVASFSKYLDPFNNLLFFTAWPMLAACLTLYLLREHDIYTLKIRSKKLSH